MRGLDVSTPLGRLLRQYFLQHPKVERRVSDNTIASYAFTFRLLIAFCLGRRKRRALSLEISDLDADTILAFLREAVKHAAETCPSLRGRRVSPHTIRHTTAMHLLESGMNLAAIALFLGHEDVQTTHGYVEADAELKRRTLSSPPHLGRGRQTSPKQRDELITFLETLQQEHRS